MEHHDYEPGEGRHAMHTDPLCRICGNSQNSALHRPVPQPVLRDSRIAIGISYFLTEEEADAYAENVVARGVTYNGGYFHGMPCGREPGRDYDHPEHGRLYAVTD